MPRVAPLLTLTLVACSKAASPPAPPAGPPLAIALVYEGHELWIGNDEVIADKDDPSRYAGILKDLEATVDATLAKAVPAGTLGTAIDYGSASAADHATVHVPMGPIAQLTGASLGTQKDYAGKTATFLVAGIERGRVELAKTTAAKKVMIIIGDGNDVNHDTAKTELGKLDTQLKADKITPYAIIYKQQISDAGNEITTLVPNPVILAATKDLPTALTKLLGECCKP